MQCQLINSYRCSGDILQERNIPNFSLTAIIKMLEDKIKRKLDATLTRLIKLNKKVRQGQPLSPSFIKIQNYRNKWVHVH
jgi:hypothetical protein